LEENRKKIQNVVFIFVHTFALPLQKSQSKQKNHVSIFNIRICNEYVTSHIVTGVVHSMASNE